MAILIELLLIIPAVTPFVVAKPPTDFSKPIPAYDVELVKKALIKGSFRGGKPTTKNVSTGVLGELCTGEKYAIIIGVQRT